MTRIRVPLLAVLAATIALPLLAACHTTAGAGEDISATGHAIDKAATRATP
jgi:predicted small secreted protein